MTSAFDIKMFSFSHQNTPIKIRDLISFSPSDVDLFVPDVRQAIGAEIAILSTCNRTEFYFYGDPSIAWGGVKSFVSGTKRLDLAQIPTPRDEFGRDAARHLFRVASSMESLALGEDQILVQVKDVHRQILGHSSKSPVLDRLYQFAIRAGKRVRTETSLCEGAVSISSASVALTKRIFGSFEKLEIALVGAGETCESAAQHFKANRANRFVVVNRGAERGQTLAEKYQGTYKPLNELLTACQSADVMVFATGATGHLLKASDLKGVMKKRGYRPIFLIDISNPRNVDPEISKISDVYLYNIDDLQEVIRDNLSSRQAEIPKAEMIIESMLDEWEAWLRTVRVRPTIANLAQFFEGLRVQEIGAYENKITDHELELLNQFSKKLTKKLLHNPIQFLRHSVEDNSLKPEDVELVTRLFDLTKDDSNE